MAPETSAKPRPTAPATATTTNSSKTTPVRASTGTKRPHSATGKPPTTPSTGGLQIKKRPYRRTKRPKNYCDKSTVTTVTTPTRASNDPNNQSSSGNPDGTNVYDAVLGECEDLLRASTEAQRLGRLKMASAYQLLLHTRLVGLGKRFDRSAMIVDQQKAKQQQQQAEQQQQHQKQLQMDSSSQEAAGEGSITKEEIGSSNGGVVSGTAATASVSRDDGNGTEPNNNNNNSTDSIADSTAKPDPTASSEATVPVALQQLRSILPGNLEMDASMMEHLARAAVELHHQRTGRKKSADGLLASPLNSGGLATTNPVAVASDAAPGAEDAAKSTTKKPSVAWTPAETTTVHKALKEGKDPYTIATTLLPSKTVAQVHAFVKNQQQLAKVTQLQQQQQVKAESIPSSAAVDPSNAETTSKNDAITPTATTTNDGNSTGSTSAKTPTAASAETKTEDSSNNNNAPVAVVKRGGRGRKPPTTAMNTVPNVMMDVKALLQRANTSTNPSSSADDDGASPPNENEN